MHFLGIEPTGYYGEVTAHAVYKFQQAHLLAGNTDSVGAGIFGPKTRATLNDIVTERTRTEKLIADRRRDEIKENASLDA
jgi:peptidoglycan hydrolase-like protein with peptidoglycan-binding domain